jgi:hypothetical protein
MRRTTVRFGKRGQDRRFKEGELANEGARVSSSEIGVLIICGVQPKRCAAHNSSYLWLLESLSGELGVALRAGLLAALKPRKRVFPLAGCHP